MTGHTTPCASLRDCRTVFHDANPKTVIKTPGSSFLAPVFKTRQKDRCKAAWVLMTGQVPSPSLVTLHEREVMVQERSGRELFGCEP